METSNVRAKTAVQQTGDGVSDLQGAATLVEVAYKRLRQDILTSIFAPGQPLRLEFLKQRYGLSFSPLREALNRLQTERLVVTVALRGFSVAPVSIDEMWDATDTRILVESQALRLSIQNGDDDWEAGIVSAFHALELQVRRLASDRETVSAEELSVLETRHKDFHWALITNCRSRRLMDIADQLYAETQRYRLPTLLGKNPAASRNVTLEHRQIMEASLARQVDQAVELLSTHYRKTSQIIESFMSRGALRSPDRSV